MTLINTKKEMKLVGWSRGALGPRLGPKV